VILTRVFAASRDGVEETVDLESEGSRERLLDWYRPERADWLRLNLVTTLSGSAAGPDGTSESITSRTDRRILGVIRQLADVVLVGAGTVRAEGYQLPKRAALAIVTSSGNLGGHRLPEDTPGDRIYVLCPAGGADRVRASLRVRDATVLELPDSADGLKPLRILESLRDVGLASVVCEGGPSLAGRLLAAGAVDELCLSQAPFLGGAAVRAFADAVELRRLELTQQLIDEASATYSRWRLPGR
jgi:riboflavin biosynthesis pyrimidine reductase